MRLVKLSPLLLLIVACGDSSTTETRDRQVLAQSTCVNRCGQSALSGRCFCDEGCVRAGDCCPDYSPVCKGVPGQCAGHCGGKSPDGCWCDEGCAMFGDCCGTVTAACGVVIPDAGPDIGSPDSGADSSATDSSPDSMSDSTPDSTTPDSTVPDLGLDTSVSDMDVPDMSLPDPDMGVADMSLPDPDMSIPDATPPDAPVDVTVDSTVDSAPDAPVDAPVDTTVDISLSDGTGGLCVSSGLAAYWPLDESSGITTEEQISGYHALLYGPDWIQGVSGSAVESVTYFAGDIFNSLAPPLTVSSWIQLHGAPAEVELHTDFQFGDGIIAGIDFVVRPTDLEIRFGDNTGTLSEGMFRAKTATTNVPLSQWVHVAGVIRGPTDMDLYVNGVDVGGVYSGNGGAVAHTAAGMRGWALGGAAIDELRIYDRALIPAEVATLAGAACGTPPLDAGVKADSCVPASLHPELQHTVHDIWADSPMELWLATSGGVYRFDGSGLTQMSPRDYRRVWGTGPNNVWFSDAESGTPQAAYYDGTSFIDDTMVGDADVWGLSATAMYTTTAAGTFRWDGSTWTSILGSAVWPIWGTATNNLYAVSTQGIIRYDGAFWTVVLSGTFDRVFGGGPNDVHAIGPSGNFIFDGTSWNSGGSVGVDNLVYGQPNDIYTLRGEYESVTSAVWQTPVSDYNGNRQQITTAGPTGLALRGDDGLLTLFDGSGWQTVGSGFFMESHRSIKDFWALGQTHVYGVTQPVYDGAGQLSGLVVLDSNGWQAVPGVLPHQEAVWAADPTNVFVVGASGIQHYDGSTGTLMQSTPGTLRDVYGTSSSDVWAVGDGGLNLHYDGTSWTSLPAINGDFGGILGPVDVKHVWFASPTQGWAVSELGVHVYNGSSWSIQQPNTFEGFLLAQSANDIWIVSETGNTAQWDGATWTTDSIPFADHTFYITAAARNASHIVAIENDTNLEYVFFHDHNGWHTLAPNEYAVTAIWLFDSGELLTAARGGAVEELCLP